MRKIKRNIVFTFYMIILIILVFACKKENPSTPTLTTSPVSNILLTSVTTGGEITNDGGEAIISRGVCWSLNVNPTIDDFKTEDGTGTGSFTSNVTNLSENTEYYLRAYASNSIGTAYGEEFKFITGAVTDVDGNVYRIVTIGDQVWMIDNLKTSTYNDGTAIPLVTNDAAWAGLSTGAYCWSDNDRERFKDSYGALYNFYAVKTEKLCPVGWHVPDIEEWFTLLDYFYGVDEAGNYLKEAGTSHWIGPNNGANNQSGFTALPGMFRSAGDGSFATFGYYAYWWVFDDSALGEDNAWTLSLIFNTGKVNVEANNMGSGLYVRCIRDEPAL
ncbi:MAG: fibrobacter succinogenes major paralogous domain-containing protein [Bacteroidales bacterium]|nr:fibrobacter succinogenes major paralogous domain-containing protein [Bacteroidales bacterium]MCF8391913.1 fibrobacter succinogenes major paralogous domain-containing protein [Bacteroidales bacterium]